MIAYNNFKPVSTCDKISTRNKKIAKMLYNNFKFYFLNYLLKFLIQILLIKKSMTPITPVDVLFLEGRSQHHFSLLVLLDLKTQVGKIPHFPLWPWRPPDYEI
jgi:hypothetical protein